MPGLTETECGEEASAETPASTSTDTAKTAAPLAAKNTSGIKKNAKKRKSSGGSSEDEDPDWSHCSVKLKRVDYATAGDADVENAEKSNSAVIVKRTHLQLEKPQFQAGEVIFSGSLDFKAAKGKAAEEKILWEFSRLSTLKGIPVKLVASSSSSVHSLIVTQKGDVYAMGRGAQGQLGIGETPAQVVEPVLIKDLKKFRVTAAATGANHSLVLTSDGDVYGFGSSATGQLGIGTYENSVPTPTKMLSKKIFVKISCGSDFSMVVDSKGYLYSCGSAESGRLGHGFPKQIIEGVSATSYENENRARRIQRYFIKDPKTKLTKEFDDVKIVDVKCGAHHTLALDLEGRVFSWGFGGYGRLGHGSACDEVQPRVINSFLGETRTAKKIFAGANMSLAVNEVGSLLQWGQGRNADMVTPQIVDSMKKKNIRAIGLSNLTVLVAAGDGLHTWTATIGQTLGQMGLTSEHKSSSAAVEVPLPSGVGVISATCGHSFSLCIVGEKDAVDAGEDGSNAAGGAKAKHILDALPAFDLSSLETEAE